MYECWLPACNLWQRTCLHLLWLAYAATLLLVGCCLQPHLEVSMVLL